MQFLEKVLALVSWGFNPKFALLALIPGFLVLWINARKNGSWKKAVKAGGVQVVVSFLTAGIGARMIESWCLNVDFWLYAYGLAGVVGMALKTVVGWIGHKLNHTPRFWQSILWPALISTATSVFTLVVLRNAEVIQSTPILFPFRLLLGG